MQNVEGLRILIVDRSKLQRTVIKRALEKEGYVVTEAENTESAALQLNSSIIDLVIMDAALINPATERWVFSLSQKSEHAPIQCIALTSRVDNEERAQLNALGINCFILKSSHEQDLVNTVNEKFSESASSDSDPIVSLRAENQRLRDQLDTVSRVLIDHRSILETENAFFVKLNHEVRTPLNGVLGLIYLMRQLPTELERSLHLDQLEYFGIELLKAFENSTANLHIEGMPLLSVCQRVTERIFKAFNVSVKFEVSQDILPMLGPVALLEEVMYKLIEAELQHSQPKTEVVIDIYLDDSVVNERTRLVFQVSVSLPLVSTSYDSLFSEPLLYDRMAEEPQLFLARAIARHLNGDIELGSSNGERNVILWVGYENFASLVTPKEERPDVIIVDDQSINLRITKSVVEKLGARVTAFQNGEDALAHLLNTNKNYDLILMDMIMPGMSGSDTARKIRKISRFSDIPIIALSGNDDDATKNECRLAGMTDFLTKSADHTSLCAMLRQKLPSLALPKCEISLADTSYEAIDSLDDQVWLAQLSSQLPMLDIKAVARVGVHNVETFMPLLKDFQQRYKKCSEQMKVLLQCADIDGLKRMLHSLKGTSATIGLNAIAAQAHVLELLLAENKTTEVFQQLGILKHQIDDFSINYDNWVNNFGAREMSNDRADVNVVLEQLSTLLEQDNPLARDYFENDGYVIKEVSPSLYVSLDDQIQNYALHEAFLLLKSFQDKFRQQYGDANE